MADGGQARLGRFRLLAFDLDGTLLDGEGRFAPETCRLLAAVAAAGVHCVAATGRRRFSALPLLRGAGVRGDCVVQNGAVVADVASGARRLARFLAADGVRRLAEFLRARGVSPVVYRDVDQGPGEVFVDRTAPDPSGFLAGYLPYAAGHHTVVDSLWAIPLDQVVRVTAHHGERGALEDLEAAAREVLPCRSFIGLDPVHRVHRLEFLHPDASKWTALTWVLERVGVAAEAVLAIGDDANDAELLARAGHSLAAPGATAAARHAAREHLAGLDAAGVRRALCRHLGIAEP